MAQINWKTGALEADDPLAVSLGPIGLGGAPAAATSPLSAEIPSLESLLTPATTLTTVPATTPVSTPTSAAAAAAAPAFLPGEPPPGEPPPYPSPEVPPAPVVPRITEADFTQLYRDWLGRDPKPGDYDQYGNDEFSKIKAMVVNSAEHIGRWDAQVNAWYNEFRGRSATPAELAALRGKYLENIQQARAEIQGATAPTPTAWKPGDPILPLPANTSGWFMGLVQGKPPTPAQLIALEPLLNSYGIKVLRNAEGVAGKIQLPGGQIVDVIISAGLGGRGWQWDTSAGGDTTLPGTPSVPLTTVPTQFNDPYTKQLEDFLKFRIEELFQPVDDPFRDQYAQLLQARTDELGGSNADIDQLLAQLRTLSGGKNADYDNAVALLEKQAKGLNPDYDLAIAKMRDEATRSDADLENVLGLLRAQMERANERPEDNPEFMKLMGYVTQRFEDLSHPGYTGAEDEVIRTAALDPIERDRAAAQQRALERISSRGMTPDSGLAQELQALVDQGFDASRGTAQTEIALNELERRNARMNEATAYAQMGYELPEEFRQSRILAGTEAGKTAVSLTAAQRQAQLAAAKGAGDLTAARLQDRINAATAAGDLTTARLLQQTQAGTTAIDIQDARDREALDTANALFGISKGVRDETQNRRQEALSLIGMLADLPVQALKNALLVLGDGTEAGDIMSSLLTIAGLNQRQGQINQSNSSGFWAGLGTLARMLQTGGTTTPTSYGSGAL